MLSICSTIFYNNQLQNEMTGACSGAVELKTSFDLVTLGNCFDAERINPVSIIETSLLKTLQTTNSFYLKPKTGYCALFKNENLILIMDSEPKVDKLSLVGIWVSGVSSVNHPLVWSACLRFEFSNLIRNKSDQFQNQFIIILFSSITKRTEFYLCKSINSKLEFLLLNGSSKFLVNVRI